MGGVVEVIGGDVALGAALVERFRALAGIDRQAPEKIREFEELARSATVARFPGVLLALSRDGEGTSYYAIAKTAAEWRQLRPLLLAFVGPTLTDFVGQVPSLDVTLPVEDFLEKGGWHVVVRLRPGQTGNVAAFAQRSLSRLIEIVDSTGSQAKTISLPTSTLISRFVNCLNGNDRSEALRIIGLLKSEMRVDALNLGFLEVQFHAHFGEWRAIREMRSFESLLWTRKPSAVSTALLESLYNVHLAPLEEGKSIEMFRKCYMEDVCALARPLLRLPAPSNLLRGGWRIYALEAICARTRQVELEQAVLGKSEIIGAEFIQALRQKTGERSQRGEADKALNTVEKVKQELTVAVEVDSLGSIRSAFASMQALSEEQRQELLRSEPFRAMWRTVQSETQNELLPASWSEWIKRATEGEFGNSLSVARRGLEEWPTSILDDSTEVDRLVNGLSSFADKAPQYDRLLDALPLLVAWIAKDPNYPRQGLTRLYEALLFHFITCSR
ncbi:MAG: hypothetical protein ABL962_17360, partial [Fimbriimonadaceae bacterium]